MKKEKQYSDNNVFVHETAVVDEPADIGSGTKIWHFSHIMPRAKIGKNCVISQNCYVASQAVLKSNVKLQNNISVYDLVTLEDGVFVGPSAVFTNVINPRATVERKDEYKATIVKKNASIGANATIVCGTIIGQSAFIGAGALIRDNVPDYAVVVGVPAKIIAWMCECGEKLLFTDNVSQCKCKRKYSRKNNKVKKILD